MADTITDRLMEFLAKCENCRFYDPCIGYGCMIDEEPEEGDYRCQEWEREEK